MFQYVSSALAIHDSESAIGAINTIIIIISNVRKLRVFLEKINNISNCSITTIDV